MTKFGEWKIWNGGEPPLAYGAMCQVQFRAESRHGAESTAARSVCDWSQDGGDYDIIAYREVIEQKRETVTLWTREGCVGGAIFTAAIGRDPGDEIRITYDIVDGVFDETTLRAERVDDR